MSDRVVDSHPSLFSTLLQRSPLWVLTAILGFLVLVYVMATALLAWIQKNGAAWVSHNWLFLALLGLVGLLLIGAKPAWKVYSTLHKHSLDTRAQKAMIEIAEEAKETIKAARERADAMDMAFTPQMTLSSLKVAPVVAKAARQAMITEEQEEAKQLPPPSIPEKVAYESVAQQVPHGHALLGVDGFGVKTCEFGKILTCLILGGSGTGKSNTVSIKVEEAIKDGWRLIVIDPHRRKPDSLYNRIKEYSDCFIRFDWLPDGVAFEDEQIKAVLRWFNDEYKHRLQTGDQSFGDVLLICDEVGYVADLDDEETVKLLKRIAKVCGNESRGFGMAGWFINQNATGIAWLRKVVMTVITHKLNMMSERRIACNENEALARNMDKWPKHGRVYVYGLSFEETYELQMPYKQEVRVVEAIPAGQNFHSAPTQKLSEQRASHVYTSRSWEATVNTMETPRETLAETASEASTKIIDGVFENANSDSGSSSSEKNFSGVSPEIRETVRRLNNIGKLSHRDIAASVGLSGRNYGIYQQVCRDLGIVTNQAKGE